ncbi:cytosine deaminase [Methylopila henanensis]|uniref:Cytosine deaminase n=1 Tax=Methylopila henanensis TaxID=873516 RepID=A0ABW4K697_9HYPH
MIELPEHAFESGRPVVLRGARTPAPFLPDHGDAPVDRDGAALVDILVADGRVAAVARSGAAPAPEGTIEVDLDGRHVWPTLVDMHAHLDKGHIVDRAPNPDGTHEAAAAATGVDREARWHHDDLVRRMSFGLACAEAHGVSAIRTHLDSHEGQGPETWGAFRAARDAFAGRVALQAVALAPMEIYATLYAETLADIVADTGGLLGGVARLAGASPQDDLAALDALLDRMFTLAAARGLDVDLHVDESADTARATLPTIARATLRHGYEGRVACGHCCSLALQDDATLADHVALVGDAGVAVVTLPTVNMYLQDRRAGRTPRWRGVTPVQELMAGGVRVAVAGDNCRDPFYAYGDHDMLDTFRQGVKILHLDHPFGRAAALAGPVPADVMGLSDHGVIRAGGPADLILLDAWSMDQVLARPQSDRIVIRDGRRRVAGPPSYAALRT